MSTIECATGALGRTRHAHAAVGQVFGDAGLVGCAHLKKLLKTLHADFACLKQGKWVDEFLAHEDGLAVPPAVNKCQAVGDFLDLVLVFADVRDRTKPHLTQQNMELSCGLSRPVEQVGDEAALGDVRV